MAGDVSGKTARAGKIPQAFADKSENTEANFAAWMAGAASAESGDAEGLLAALLNMKGSLRPLDSNGRPSRNALAKKVESLRKDSDAWRRLKEGAKGFFEEKVSDDATPSSIEPTALLWAISPEAVAKACGVWRRKAQAEGRWWGCPFVNRCPDGGRSNLAEGLSVPMRLFLSTDLDLSEDKAPGRTSEFEALREAIVELCAAGIQERLPYERRARELREAGETVWPRGSSQMGLDWGGFGFAFKSAGGEEAGAMASAIDRLMDDAGAGGPEALRELACAVCGAFPERSGAVVDRWRSTGGRGLPFGPWDHLPPRILAVLPVPDDEMGAWLFEVGRHWSAPAALDYSGSLAAGAPKWSIGGTARTMASGIGLEDWTPLEWMLVLGSGEAVRDACLRGARIDPRFEEALEFAGDGSRPAALNRKKYWSEEKAAWLEACRLVEAAGPAEACAAKKVLRV